MEAAEPPKPPEPKSLKELAALEKFRTDLMLEETERFAASAGTTEELKAADRLK